MGALTISSVTDMYPTAVIFVIWARDSFCVVHRFQLPCHMSKMLWTLAIVGKFVSSAFIFVAESFSVFLVSNSASTSAKIPWLAEASCLTTTVSRSLSPVGYDCLQPGTSSPREKLAYTLTPCGMMEYMSQATLERSAYFQCISSCWCQLSVMPSINNVLQISIGSEW